MIKVSVRHLWVGAIVVAVLATGGALRAANSFRVGEGKATENLEVVDIPLTMTNDEPVQGLAMVLEWDDCWGEGIDLKVQNGPSEALEGVDFFETRVEDDYMILTVVVDLDGDGPDAIAPGDDHHLATAQIRCICDEGRHPVALALPIKSVRSMVDGGRLIDNMIVSDGYSVRAAEGLELENGELVCNDDGGGPVDNPKVTCGALSEDGDLLPAEGEVGENVPVCFFYQAPEPAEPHLGIQGFSLSVEYDCKLECLEDRLDIAGSVLEEVGVDFLQMHCDNDPDDEDGCEMIVGMLVEATPSADGKTLPGAADLRQLFCVDYLISDRAVVGDVLSVDFIDGLDGRGTVPTRNLVSIEFFEQPWESAACEVRVVDGGGGEDPEFIRGDCNFNMLLNVADAAAIVGHLFLGDEIGFEPPCLDACDADGSTELEITDAIFLLNYLFVPGSPVPPAPGPDTPGPSPDEDSLGCEGGE